MPLPPPGKSLLVLVAEGRSGPDCDIMMTAKRNGLPALLGGTALLALAGLAGWLWMAPRAPERPVVAAAPPAAAPAATTAPAADRPVAGAPRFDIARIGAGGDAVIAGQAAPGDEVSLTGNDRELGRARADSRGAWVILPEVPLAPGTHALSVQARGTDGSSRLGGETVVVVVPERGGEAPLAVLLPPPEAPGPTPARSLAGTPGRLGLEVIEYDEEGAMRFAGGAPPGSLLRLYIDQAHAGEVRADREGRWEMQPAPIPEPGRHTLRLDQIGAGGKVAARLELPFQRDRHAGPPAAGQVVVQPGNSLWRIARRSYGRGTRYTVIYAANRSQIRDPARIYPGQVFALPAR